MGKRGPGKTPTKVLQMRGSPVAKNRTGEPVGTVGAPVQPDWLDELAQAEWQRLVPELRKMRVLTLADQAALAILCASWSEYRQAKAIVDKVGPVAKTPKGRLIKHPALQAQEQAYTRWERLAKQFGLTPSARAGMAVEQPNPEENRGKNRFFG